MLINTGLSQLSNQLMLLVFMHNLTSCAILSLSHPLQRVSSFINFCSGTSIGNIFCVVNCFKDDIFFIDEEKNQIATNDDAGCGDDNDRDY